MLLKLNTSLAITSVLKWFKWPKSSQLSGIKSECLYKQEANGGLRFKSTNFMQTVCCKLFLNRVADAYAIACGAVPEWYMASQGQISDVAGYAKVYCNLYGPRDNLFRLRHFHDGAGLIFAYHAILRWLSSRTLWRQTYVGSNPYRPHSLSRIKFKIFMWNISRNLFNNFANG